MPANPCLTLTRHAAMALWLLLLAGCTHLDAVRDFGKSAATMSTYPVAATTYVDSAVTSAPYVAAAPDTLVVRALRAQQVDEALALHAALSDYFAMLARLAGADVSSLSTLKSMGSDLKSVSGGKLDRATLDASANLMKTLGEYAVAPARERAVKDLVRDGGPNAMRVLTALRSVSADWRAQVENDARQVDDTLAVAVLAKDVTPLLRILANDRRAELSRSYAVNLRKMRAVERSLAAVETAHADLVTNLDDLGSEPLRRRLQAAVTDLARGGRVAGRDALTSPEDTASRFQCPTRTPETP